MGSPKEEQITRRDFLGIGTQAVTAATVAGVGWWLVNEVGAPVESAPQKKGPVRGTPPEEKAPEKEGPKYGTPVSFQIPITSEPRYWYVKDIAGKPCGSGEGLPLFPGQCAFTGVSEAKKDFNGTATISLNTMSPQDAWTTVCARAGFDRPLVIQLANHARVSPWSVFALAFQESRAFPKRRGNAWDGTYDEGLLQLNSKSSHGQNYFRGFLQKLAVIYGSPVKAQTAWALGAWKLVTGKDHAGELPLILQSPSKAVEFAEREYKPLNPNQNVATGLWLVGDDLGRIEEQLGSKLSFSERSRLMLMTLYTGVSKPMTSAAKGLGTPLPFETLKTRFFANLKKVDPTSVYNTKKRVVGERDFLYRLMMEYLSVMTGCMPVKRCGILQQATAKAQ